MQKGGLYRVKYPNEIYRYERFENDIKYKWNGLLTNLNGLSPEDYAKTEFNVVGIVITGNTGSTIVTNQIVCTYDKTGENYGIKAKASKATASDVTITIMVNDTPYEILLPLGTSTASIDTDVPVSEEEPTVVFISVVPETDDKYQYTVVVPKPTPTVNTKVYYGVVDREGAENISGEAVAELESIFVTENPQYIRFVIPMSNEEKMYCLVMGIPKELAVNIADVLGGSPFEVLKDTNIDSDEYTLIWAHDDDDTTYVSRDDEDVTYEFTIKL